MNHKGKLWQTVLAAGLSGLIMPAFVQGQTQSPAPSSSLQGSDSRGSHAPGSGEMEGADRTGSTGPSGSRSFTPSGGAVDPAGRAAKPAGDHAVTDADRDTVARVRSILAGNPSLAGNTADNIHIAADNGAITLEGWVKSKEEKERITAQVRQLPGVVSVTDKLRIGS